MPDETTTQTTEAPAQVGGGSLLGGNPAVAAAAAPPAVAAPVSTGAPQSIIGADGNFAPGWLDTLPEALRGNPSLTTVPSLAALAESYVATKGLVGKRMQPPAENATPQEVAAWRKTVGAPDTPEGYGELRPEDFPEAHWDKETAGQFAALAHKHHLPPGAVKDIIGLHANSVKASLGKLEAEENSWQETETAKLKQSWGTNFEAEAHAATTFVKALGMDPLNPVFRNAEVVQAMARGAKMMMGDKLITGQAPGGAGGIEARIGDLQRSPEYLGQRGEEAQRLAQSQIHALMQARSSKAA